MTEEIVCIESNIECNSVDSPALVAVRSKAADVNDHPAYSDIVKAPKCMKLAVDFGYSELEPIEFASR